MQGSTLQFNGVDQVEWFLAGESFVPTFLGCLFMLLIVTFFFVLGTFYFWKFEVRSSQHKYKNEEGNWDQLESGGLESSSWQAMQTMDRATLQFQELRQRGHMSTDNHTIGSGNGGHITPLYPPGYSHNIVRPPPINISLGSVAPPFYAMQPHPAAASSSLYQQSNNVSTSDLLPRPTILGGPKQRKKSDSISISRLSPTAAGTCGSRSASRDSADGGMGMMRASLIVSVGKDSLSPVAIGHTAFAQHPPTQESIYGNYFDHHHNLIANHPLPHDSAPGIDSVRQYLSPLPPVPSPQQPIHHHRLDIPIPIPIQPNKIIRDFLLENEHTDVLELGLSVPYCITESVHTHPISPDEQQIIRPPTDTSLNGIRASKPLYRLRDRGFSPMLLSSADDDDDGERSERDNRGSHRDMVEGMMHKVTAQTQHNQNNNNNNNNNNQTNSNSSSNDSSSHLLRLDLKDLSLDHVLGGGAFGQVWAGTWRGTPVAVKVLSAVCQRNLPAQVLLAFEDEVSMLARLRHPNICLYMGACMDPPNRAIVTELVTRGSLWEVLRTPNLFNTNANANNNTNNVNANISHRSVCATEDSPVDGGFFWPRWAVRRVLDDTCRGLVYLHSFNPPIIHRDLKSANLLLDDSFHVKICDFGLARLRDFNTTMTANVGTVQWMAPEVLRGLPYGESADIFSLAVVAWELLTGSCPYENLSHLNVAIAVTQQGARPTVPDHCSYEQKELLARCWSEDPSQRPSAVEMLKTLELAFPV